MSFSNPGAGLSNADDVFFDTLADGQTIQYNGSTAKWNNVVVSPSGARPIVFQVAANDAPALYKTAADYVCDGTDDQVQINAALAAIPDKGGKIVLSPGTFSIAAPILVTAHNTTIEGAGTGQVTGATQVGVGTKLLATSALTTQMMLVQRTANNVPVYGVYLKDFTAEGLTSAPGAVDGIVFRSNRGIIFHVHVHRFTGAGVRVMGYTTPTAWDTYDTHISHSQFGQNAIAGIYMDTDSPDGHILSNVFYQNYDSIYMRSSSQQITSNHFYNATHNNIHFEYGGSRTKIIGNKIEGAGEHGINIDTTNGGFSDIQIVGNGITSNGDSANNTFDNIAIQGPNTAAASRTLISGNSFATKSGITNKPRYALSLSSAAQNTLVVGNGFGSASSYGTGILSDGSAGSAPALFRSNVNLITESNGTATITSGTTSITVTHGITPISPSAREVSVTPTNNMGAATKFWVANVGATTFDIMVNADPAASATFAWSVNVLN